MFLSALRREQFLPSKAPRVPASEQVPAGHHVTLVHTPPEQFPMPVIRPSAEASAVKISAGGRQSENSRSRGATACHHPIFFRSVPFAGDVPGSDSENAPRRGRPIHLLVQLVHKLSSSAPLIS